MSAGTVEVAPADAVAHFEAGDGGAERLHGAGAFVAEGDGRVAVVRVGAAEAGMRDLHEDGGGREGEGGAGFDDRARGGAGEGRECGHVGCRVGGRGVENVGRLVCDGCGEYVGFGRIKLRLACLLAWD